MSLSLPVWWTWPLTDWGSAAAAATRSMKLRGCLHSPVRASGQRCAASLVRAVVTSAVIR